jgi:biopolymer transport protein ExbB/TolQ
MSDILTILGIIGGIIAVVVAIAGAVVLARASYARAQLEQLREHNTDLTDRNDFLEKEVLRLQGEKKAAEAARDVATEMVTQRADLQAHHEEVMQTHTRMFGVLEALKGILEEVLKNVRKHS